MDSDAVRSALQEQEEATATRERHCWEGAEGLRFSLSGGDVCRVLRFLPASISPWTRHRRFRPHGRWRPCRFCALQDGRDTSLVANRCRAGPAATV